MEGHLNRYGRIHLILPVYLALAKNGSDAELANDLFDGAKNTYHPLTVMIIERSLDKAEQGVK
jgi:hypothetical protein